MKKLLPLLLAAVLIGSVSAQAKTVILSSLDWPPYTGAALRDLGASAAVAKAAFAAMGYTLKIEFFPWERAVNLAKGDPKYAGYFPEYYSSDNAKDFIYSAPMGTGPLGFVERKAAPVRWTSLDDLGGIKIGVVSGYINTDEFDSRVASGKISVDEASDDATNIMKVAGGRLPLAVIDPNVMAWLLANIPTLKNYRDVVQFNTKPLELKKLYVCFKKGSDGERLSAIFNEGLTKIDADRIMKDYFASLGLK